MGFKSIFQGLTARLKPGVSYLNDFSNPSNTDYSPYVDGSNGGAACDLAGSLWVRDAGAPIGFFDPANPFNTENMGYLAHSRWSSALNNIGVILGGDGGGLSAPVAVFSIRAVGGSADPAVTWNSEPLYLQIHNNQIIAPVLGEVPAFSFPVPKPPEMLVFAPGVQVPVNGVDGSTGGMAIYFSTTEATYTPDIRAIGNITVNWAYYFYSL